MQVLGDRIFLKKQEIVEEVIDNGSVILAVQPTKVKRHIYEGKVIFVGDDVKKVNVDSKILYDIRGAQTIKVEEEEYTVITTSNVIAIL